MIQGIVKPCSGIQYYILISQLFNTERTLRFYNHMYLINKRIESYYHFFIIDLFIYDEQVIIALVLQNNKIQK